MVVGWELAGSGLEVGWRLVGVGCRWAGWSLIMKYIIKWFLTFLKQYIFISNWLISRVIGIFWCWILVGCWLVSSRLPIVKFIVLCWKRSCIDRVPIDYCMSIVWIIINTSRLLIGFGMVTGCPIDSMIYLLVASRFPVSYCLLSW